MINKYEIIGIRTISKNDETYYLAYCKSDQHYNDQYVNGYTIASCFVSADVGLGDVIRIMYIKSENRYIYIPD